jgi:small subunit ribosomal protein S8
MLTDPVSDYLSRIRNGLTSQHREVEVPASRLKKEMSRILKEQGYITDYAVEPKPVGETIRIQLKYTEDRQPVISGLRRVSKAGRRQYADADGLPRVLGGMGTAIITTSRGVMTANRARQEHVGGEIVAYVW